MNAGFHDIDQDHISMINVQALQNMCKVCAFLQVRDTWDLPA